MTPSTEEVLTAVGAVFGLFICLAGGRFSRLYCFVLGFVFGTSFLFWVFEPQSASRHGTIPFIVGLLVSLFSGVLCLLLHMLSMGSILGSTAAAFLLLLDNGRFFAYYRGIVWAVMLLIGIAYTLSRPNRSLLVTTAASGALMLTLSIDSLATRSLGAVIFQDTFLEATLDVESAVARCFNWRCWLLLPFWACLTCFGYATQYYSHRLRLYEQSWPLLFVTPKRANFGSSPARSSVTESLIAEDRNYAITNYASYENYQKIQTAQQQAQQAQQAAINQQQQTQPTAAPELGSAHADDKVSLPPAARASFNFLDVKRLPAQSQYLYLVIQNSFQGLVRTFGFQLDNMQNQYEHLIFLIVNYQNNPSVSGVPPPSTHSSPATTSSASSSGGGTTAATGGSDFISQLHTRMFSNYREWIAYMCRGGNSAIGGSAITTDIVPLVKSQIAEARVDRNTTDAKIEEMCLWLLVWGESGSLRHTPECLLFLFHNMCAENRRYQLRFGGGFLDAPVSAHTQRPRRAAGDFLTHVVQPIYEVMAKENSKHDSVRKNYDDINEFFWRKSCLDYYYAADAYRVEASADIEAGSGTAAADAVHPHSAISISVALTGSRKSFLEKRSWLHPARSFIRLISFYGVCFHLLVAIAYIHYANLPLLGAESNKILSSFVMSVAVWSVLKEVMEMWATYGIITELVWNTIGFVMRLAVKTTMCCYLCIFYLWSDENDDPILRSQYYAAYLVLSCLYLLPLAMTILLQLFPTLGHQLQSAKLPFVDELSKIWYPIQKLYVGRDIHEPEVAIYKYQVFWVCLLTIKMYLSLLFQVSPLIQPTVDILRHIDTLSQSTRLWMHYANYFEIVVLWLPFILVYMFDTVIYYFLFQAIIGVMVGMKLHLGEVREFSQLIRCFDQLPRHFDEKIVYSKQKVGVGVPIVKNVASSIAGSPLLRPIPERESLLAVDASGHMIANAGYQTGVGIFHTPAPTSATSSPMTVAASSAPNLTAPLSTARGRRGSLPSLSGVDDPFRNRAWENFAVVWNEIIEDLRTGDLLSNAERGLLRFRFDTTSEVEFHLPLSLLVGHIDAAIEHAVDAHQQWKRAMAAEPNGLDSFAKTHREEELLEHFSSRPIRRECVAELWEHIGWLLHSLLGDRHAESLRAATAAARELMLVNQHVLRGTNLSALPRVKTDLLNLVRGLRIAAASFATLRLAEAERDRRTAEEREREELEELEREEARREELEAEAEAREEKESSVSVADGYDSDTEREKMKKRKELIHESEKKFRQTSLARAKENDLKSLLRSPSSGTLDMLNMLQSRPRHRSAAFVPTAAADDTGYLILHISLIRDQLSALINSLAACIDTSYNRVMDGPDLPAGAMRSTPDLSALVTALRGINMENSGFMWDGAYAGQQIHAFLKNGKTNTVLSTLHSLLTIAAIDAEPQSPEAIRRLLFFTNSLFMDLPVAPAVRNMKSLSTLTPFHSEDIVYSFSDLERKTEDGVSVFFYLQTIYPLQWQNFLERNGIAQDAFHSSHGRILSSNKKWNMEARLWATMRGQTLARTVDGMMLYERALKLLLKLEEPDIPHDVAGVGRNNEVDEASLLVQQKYQYTISCLAHGTMVSLADGRDLPVEQLKADMRLVGSDTTPVAINDVVHGYSDQLYQLRYAHGQHTVTPNHLVTVRYGSDPTSVVSKLTPDSSYLSLVVEWGDADELGKRVTHSFRFLTPDMPTPEIDTNDHQQRDIILPRGIHAYVYEFAAWWLNHQQESGVRILRRGDLIDVTAERLAVLMEQYPDAYFGDAATCTIPLVHTGRPMLPSAPAPAVTSDSHSNRPTATPVVPSVVSPASSTHASDDHSLAQEFMLKKLHPAAGLLPSVTDSPYENSSEVREVPQQIDYVYLHEAVTSKSTVDSDRGSFALAQLERALKLLQLPVSQPNVVTMAVDATDDARRTSINHALQAKPKAIIAFGSLLRHLFMADADRLTCVQSVRYEAPSDTAGSESLTVTLKDDHEVRVVFAGELSSWWLFDTVVHALAHTHGVPPVGLDDLPLYSSLLSLTRVGGGAYTAVDVSAADRRFLLSDGALTHNCQVYGKQRRENDPKAADIEYLLHTYPSLRVAYIDTLKVPRRDARGQRIFAEEFYSVLIKSERSPTTGAQEIKEVYRIRLPGNPVLGEGKPENQNHAIVFTRGEHLQTIDMNQSNYLEEALKMRNLLEEFNVAPGEKRVGIVGFREHIYTGGLSSIANFMALQEGCFVTTGQRVLDNPLRVRFHYGHPDCLLFGTMVALADGTTLAAEEVTAGMELAGEDGEVVEVAFVQHLESNNLYRLTTDAGEYTVTAEHQLTLQCIRGPEVRILKHASKNVYIAELSWIDATTFQPVRHTQSFLPTDDNDSHDESQIDRHATDPADGEDEHVDLFATSHDPADIADQLITDKTVSEVRTAAWHWIHEHAKLTGYDRLDAIRAGQLVEVRAEQLALNWHTWRMGTDDAAFSGRRVPLPLPNSSTREAQTMSKHASFGDALSSAEVVLTVDADVCTHSAMLSIGDGHYETLEATHAPDASIAYMLYHSSTDDATASALGDAGSSFQPLDRVHQALQLETTASKSTVLLTESTMIGHRAGRIEQADAACRRTMEVVLQRGVSTIVAFGDHARYNWETDAASLNGVSAVQHGRNAIGVPQTTLEYHGRLVTVLYSPLPHAWSQVLPIGLALASAHGVDPTWSTDRISSGIVERIRISAIAPVREMSPIVNIAIKNENKRYALANGSLTHNCFDKLFFMSRGGVSKASRGIHLSEDIFAGFNSVLRGGSVKFREYIQVGKGRDVGLQQLFKFEAKLAQGNCFPAADHQLLTERGWMTLDDVTAHFDQHDQLQVACSVEGRMEFHGIDRSALIVQDGTHHLIEIDSGKKQTAGISLTPTANHRMWCRLGEWSQPSDRPSYAIHSAEEVVERSAANEQAAMQLQCNFDLGLAADGAPLPFAAALGLSGAERIDAFIWLYGYWLAAGDLDHRETTITFEPKKRSDCARLERILTRLALPKLASVGPGQHGYTSFAVTGSDSVRRYAICSREWWSTFAGEYGCSHEKVTPKWLWQWSFKQLGARRIRVLLAGLRCEDLEHADDMEQGDVMTDTVRFRDEVDRICIAAGYSTMLDTQHDPITRRPKWVVRYSTSSEATEPKLRVQEACRRIEHDGRVWCVTVPTKENLIMFRRVLARDVDGAVRSASRPTVVGNSMQSVSRDIYRIANTVDFFRLCSFFFGGVGFYITNCLTIWALYLFIYTRLILAGFRLESLDSFSGADTISYWFGLIGFLLTLPVFATIGLEQGFRTGFYSVMLDIAKGSPAYFLFHMGTKSYFFEQTMLAGGAKYRPTGRGFVTRHEHFAELYRFHAASHIYRSVELLTALSLYALVIPPTYSYSLVTWAGWLLIASWLFGPFWFNPLAFEWEKTLQDFEDFTEWMGRRDSAIERCWEAWWRDENSYLDGLEKMTRGWLILGQMRYVIVAGSLVYFVDATRQQVYVSAALLALLLLTLVFVRTRADLRYQLPVRLVKAVLVVAILVGVLYVAEFVTLSSYEFFQFAMAIVALIYLLHATCNSLLICGVRARPLVQWYKLVDCIIAGCLFFILGLLSITIVPGIVQTRLMFHNAFSRGVLIDKLLKTKPSEATTGGATSAAAVGPATPKVRSRRRKDARRRSVSLSAGDDDSPEAHTAPGGFDLEAISFIERRGGGGSSRPRKTLHPSKQESASASASTSSTVDEPSVRRSKKMPPGLPPTAPRPVTSFTNLENLEESIEDVLSPMDSSSPFARSRVGSHSQRSASSTPTTVAGGPVPLPSYPSPRLASTLTPLAMMRTDSGHNLGALGSGAASPLSIGLVRSGSSSNMLHHSSSSSGSPLFGSSPVPGSPHFAAAAGIGVRRASDKMLTSLPERASQDERPIPPTTILPTHATLAPPGAVPTVGPHAANAGQFPPSVTNSPLNPRRA